MSVQTPSPQPSLAFSDTLIQPLSEAHVAWCEHAKFRDYFNHVFDFATNDTGIGVAFTGTMALCYAGVQDKVACWEHLKKWLEDDLRKPEDNLIVAAIVLGNKDALTLIQEAAQLRIDPRKIPWDKMVKALAKMTSATEKGTKAVSQVMRERATETMKDAATAQIAAEFSGPLTAIVKGTTSSAVKPLSSGIIAVGAASGKALIPVVIKGYLGGSIRNLKFALREAFPFLSPAEAQGMALQAMDGKLKSAYRGAAHERAFLVYVNPNVAPDIPQELHVGTELPGGKKVCDWLMEHGLSEPEQIGTRAPLAAATGEMAPLKVPEAKVKESRWTKPESNVGMTCTVLGAALAFVSWWQLTSR